jgi:hypothetical protein
MSVEDEARAETYRTSLAARAAFADWLQTQLRAADPATAAAVKAAWGPMREGPGFHPVEGVD